MGVSLVRFAPQESWCYTLGAFGLFRTALDFRAAEFSWKLLTARAFFAPTTKKPPVRGSSKARVEQLRVEKFSYRQLPPRHDVTTLEGVLDTEYLDLGRGEVNEDLVTTRIDDHDHT